MSLKVSPFTGGKVEVLTKDSTVTFRGEKITAPRQYYKCMDTGHEFTDAELDDDFLWAIFRKYCTDKFSTFTEMLDHFIPELIDKKLDDDQKIYDWLSDNFYYNDEFDGFQSRQDHPCMDREDMLEFAKFIKKVKYE